MEALLKIEDVCKILNLSDSTIRRKIKKKEIPYVKIGDEIRFRPRHIEGWIDNKTIGKKIA